jgi:hypothetical protein
MNPKPLWIGVMIAIILTIIFYLMDKIMLRDLSFSVAFVIMIFACIAEKYDENNGATN